MTFAFNIDTVFQQVLSADNDVLRYIVKDDPLGEEESIGHDRDVIFAAGGYLGEGALVRRVLGAAQDVDRRDATERCLAGQRITIASPYE